MKNYLSYGGGVNSTAMLILLTQEGWHFESIYVDHGADWPETRAYVKRLSKIFPITILKPNVQGCTTLYQYLKKYSMIPSRRNRWCTSKFKVGIINKYIDKPCFSLIGFSSDESHRAKLSIESGVENRFPLIEYGIDREGCKKIIKDYGLQVPIKSGCWFCPFQKKSQWVKLRKEHPELFCKAIELEKNQIRSRAERGKGPIYLMKKPLLEVVEEKQLEIWEDLRPPCQCGF